MNAIKLFFDKILNRKEVPLKSRPQASYAKIKEAVEKEIGAIPTEWNLFLVGVRGYYRDSMGKKGVNDRGIYDDAVFIVYKGEVLSFNFNVDPSGYKEGVAILRKGIHWYKKGLHGITRPNPYKAFRPATPDESLIVNRQGQTGTSKGIAINLHRGGVNGTSSLGCQTVPPQQWIEFQTLVYGMMEELNISKFPYVLIDGPIN